MDEDDGCDCVYDVVLCGVGGEDDDEDGGGVVCKVE